jgi:hypothetical protein
MYSERPSLDLAQTLSSAESKVPYPVGQNATAWLEKRRVMTDEQFQEYRNK